MFIFVPFLEIRRANNPLCHSEPQVIDYQALTKHRKALQSNHLRAIVTHCGAMTCDTVWLVLVMLCTYHAIRLG